MRRSIDQIAAVVRERICRSPADGEIELLHEGLLAEEFGVSRTPIRQVLQKLAYEHLVETRTGVGTIPSPLNLEMRLRHEASLRAMLRASADASVVTPLNPSVNDKIAALALPDDPVTDGYFARHSRLLEIVTSVVEDRILSDALRAAYWRWIRWRMSDRKLRPEQAEADLNETLARVADVATVGDLLRGLSESPL